MKKALSILTATLLLPIFVTGQGYLWVNQSIGEVGIGTADGRDVACDTEGNTYVVGNFKNTVYFGEFEVSGEFGTMYLAKYDPLGNPVWVRQINGNSNNKAHGIAVDNDQNIYICGEYKQTNELTILDFGSIQVTGNASPSTFIAKSDKDGNWQWVSTILSSDMIGNQYCIPDEILVNNEGHLFIAGKLNNAVTIEGSQYNTEYGNVAAFYFTRFKLNGELSWFKSGRGIFTGIEYADTKVQRIVFAGRADNTLKYNTDSITGQGNGDVVFGAIDHEGNLSWWQTAGHPSYTEQPSGIAVDNDRNIYLAFNNFFWIKIGDLTIDYNGISDQYLYKFDEQGEYLWTQPLYNGSVNGVNGIKSVDILTDPDGKAYVTGSFESPYYFGNPIFFTDTVGGYGYKECFMAAYHANGSYADVSACIFDESYDNGEFIPSHLAFDHDLNITLVGKFRDNIMVDDVLLQAGPVHQMFVYKVKPADLFDFSSSIFDQETENINLSIHPNPFTSSTTIEYELEKAETVTISFYDQYGKLVERMELQHAGDIQQMTWNAESLPAGIYFCELKTAHVVQSLKMIKLNN